MVTPTLWTGLPKRKFYRLQTVIESCSAKHASGPVFKRERENIVADGAFYDQPETGGGHD